MLPATLDRVLPVPLRPAGRSDGSLLGVAICHAWVRKVRIVSLVVAPALLISFAGCAAEPSEDQPPATDRLILAGYSVAAPVYQSEIIPLFQSFWRERSGREVVVESTFGFSGAQAQAVIGGFAADVVVLSLVHEVERLAEEGLIEHDWRDGPFRGVVTESLVGIAVRRDNPRDIRGWEDLTRPDVAVLMPSARTSGGAMWCIGAIYAAGLFPSAASATASADSTAVARLLAGIQRRILVMDRSALRAMQTFNSGLGDALVTYENAILRQRRLGQPLELVIPDRTLRIENPAAVVDRYAEAHGVREVAEAFVAFLVSPEAQRAFARFGMRPVDPEIFGESRESFPAAGQVFDIEELGGWAEVQKTLFGAEGLWTRILQQGS